MNPAAIVGTPPRRLPPDGGGPKNPNKGKGGKPKASQPDVADVGGKKKNKGGSGVISEPDALNPPFDPRMRRIGSPLNMTTKMKRGWIQDDAGTNRVNFLFNPAQLDVSSSVYDAARTEEQIPADDIMSADYPSMGTKTGVKLLYDRTYEMFSAPKNGEPGFANEYGVWADIAAWYVFLKMLPEMPTSWATSMITDPMQRVQAYLCVGPQMMVYGWVTGISVTYSHWTQNMVPVRASVDIGFEVLPAKSIVPTFGNFWDDMFSVPSKDDGGGWFGDLNGWVQENFG